MLYRNCKEIEYLFISNETETISDLKMSKRSRNEGTSSIYHFFPKKNKSSISASEFYNHHLPKEPNKEDINNTIQVSNSEQMLKIENEKLKQENAKLIQDMQKIKNDYASLKVLYNKVCRTYVSKDLKIDLLEKRCIPGGLLFESHKEELGDDVLKNLRKLKGCRKSDSTFVLKCMRKLYENQNDKLQSRSARGKEGKTIITPKKREIIQNLLLERLSNEGITAEEVTLRIDRLNDLINDAIANILRKKVRIELKLSSP